MNKETINKRVKEIKSNPCKKHRDDNIIFVSPNKKVLIRFCTKCFNYTDGYDVKRTHDIGT